ncbi:MAG TPA: SPW repeat protein [Actinomycetota bacterium]|jgi:hypothetical protein|nr:SPW repeat protein [Actinomycetota bacterium]
MYRRTTNRTNSVAAGFDWVNLLAAIWLFIAPWVLTFTGNAGAAWDAWLTAIGIFVVALTALSTRRSMVPTGTEGINVLLGIWLFVSPWVLTFTGLTAAAWNAWATGVLVTAASLGAMFTSGGRRRETLPAQPHEAEDVRRRHAA